MSSKVSVAVFDIGNVLVQWDPRNLYTKIFADPKEMHHFLDVVCPPPWNLEQDRGRPWQDAIAEATARHPKYAKEIEAYRARWPEMLGQPIEANVRLMADLKAAGVPVYGITNFASDTFAVAQSMLPFLNTFDGVIVSGDERLIKPDAAIFELFLSRYGQRAGDCVFIDDSAYNVEGAERVGMHAVHYGLGLDARAAFRQLGLPV